MLQEEEFEAIEGGSWEHHMFPWLLGKPLENSHGPKAARAPGTFGQCFQALGGIVEMFYAGPGIGFSDPSGCFPPQQIP